MAKNKISKNLIKTGETGIMTSIGVLVSFVLDKTVLPLPADIQAAVIVVVTAVAGGLYNLIKHVR